MAHCLPIVRVLSSLRLTIWDDLDKAKGISTIRPGLLHFTHTNTISRVTSSIQCIMYLITQTASLDTCKLLFKKQNRKKRKKRSRLNYHGKFELMAAYEFDATIPRAWKLIIILLLVIRRTNTNLLGLPHRTNLLKIVAKHTHYSKRLDHTTWQQATHTHTQQSVTISPHTINFPSAFTHGYSFSTFVSLCLWNLSNEISVLRKIVPCDVWWQNKKLEMRCAVKQS